MKYAVYLAGIILITQSATAQIQIIGPQCVVIDTEYQYNIEGFNNGSDSGQICIDGGTFANGSSECVVNNFTSFVRVIWNRQVSKGMLFIRTSSDDATISVSISKPLDGGKITGKIIQQIPFNSMPVNLICSDPKDGSCEPEYQMLWERSSDCWSWEPMPSETSGSLLFKSPLSSTTYYRRKTIERSSGTVVYSDTAVVYVDIDRRSNL